MWTLFLTIYCTNPGPGPCPAHTEAAAQAWNLTAPQTQAQCEELRALILGQQPAPGLPRGFVLDAVCLSDRSGALSAPTGLRLAKG